MKRMLAALGALLIGCGASSTVITRVVDGRTLRGAVVPPDAYALFLRGAIAEARDVPDEALAAYEAVAQIDDHDAEVFARIAQLRCTRDPKDPKAQEALRRAYAIDPDYGPAFAAEAKCDGSVAAAEHAARVEPRDVAIQVAYANALAKQENGAARERLLALSLAEPHAEALMALAAWADAHDDLDLLELALTELTHRSPQSDSAVATQTLVLVGEGQLGRARRVAGALLDARSRRGHGGAPIGAPLLAPLGRLGVDEAAVRGDEDALRRRAVAAHMPLGEAAARAALAGRNELARSIAQEVLRADPNDATSRATLVSLGVVAPAPSNAHVVTLPASACMLLTRAVWRASGPLVAQHAALVPCEPMAPDDDPALAVAVDLAAHGALDAISLPVVARIELAWRTRQAPADVPEDLDLRHELLARAQIDAHGTRTSQLAARLARRGASDPMVLAALVVVARAHGETVVALAHAAVATRADPLLDATLLDALPTGPDRIRVRARFAGIAATPAERALAR